MQEFEDQKVEQVDSNITVVQKLLVLAQNQDYITNIVTNADSTVWKLTFASHPDNPEIITFGKNGEDGHTPEVTVAYDPITEKWFWVIDGERTSMEVTGQDGGEVTIEDMRAVVPIFRVDPSTGYWLYSTDQGKTWDYVPSENGKPVSADGKDGENDKWIKSVTISEDGKWVTIEIWQPDGTSTPIVFPYRV